jgi:hypothetical protein
MRARTQNNYAIDRLGITRLNGVVRIHAAESRSIVLREE